MSLGLVVAGSPSITEWLQVGKALKKAQGAVQWWIGDWLNYGERAYGEMYAQALEETDYTYTYLRNLKYVAGQIALSHRCDSLSWRHHLLVAPLPSDEQRYWLQCALNGGGKPWSVATLRAAIREAKNPDRLEWVKYSDVWNIPACDDRYGTDYPGRIPGQIVLNVLYYYTDEGDLVIDPMAGGGVTIDACAEFKRRCTAFDIVPSRDDIIQVDATAKWPLSQSADLVFIDPPYWSQMASDYGGMASKPYDEYLEDMTNVFANSYDALREDGLLAVLIAPLAIQHGYTDIPFDFVAMCKDIGFKLIRRIYVPVSSQQVGPQVVSNCKENQVMVALMRDLLIFEKNI